MYFEKGNLKYSITLINQFCLNLINLLIYNLIND